MFEWLLANIKRLFATTQIAKPVPTTKAFDYSLFKQELALRLRYFANQEHALFKSEYEICRQVSDFLNNTPELKESDLPTIVDICNQMAGVEHYDGSGWYDFQIRLSYLFGRYNYDSDWDRATGRVTITRKGAL